MRKNLNTGPSVSEIKMRGDLDRVRRELAKLKNAAPAEAAAAAAAELEGDLIVDEGLAAAVITLREQIDELTATRHRLSRLYFQHLEDARSRGKGLRSLLRALGENRGAGGAVPLLSHLARCVSDHSPFRMVVARLRQGDRMVAVAFAGVPDAARAEIAARTPGAGEVESWMSDVHRVGEAFHIPHGAEIHAEIPGWLPTFGARENDEWHAEDVLLVPVRNAAGELVAVFSLDDPSDRAVPSSETLEGLELVARYASVALDLAALQEAHDVETMFRAERRARLRELRDRAVAGGLTAAGSGAEFAEEDARARLAARLGSLDRLEDALLDSEAGPGDLGLALEEAALDLQTVADSRQITLKLQNAVTDTEVEAGRGPLRELVLQLGRNALSFTPAGGTVSFRLSGDASDVMLEVADTGRGIASERIPHVFGGHRGLTAPAPETGEAGGIGLAVCRMVVEWHGGRIFLESGEGRGTRVSVILPRWTPRREHERK